MHQWRWPRFPISRSSKSAERDRLISPSSNYVSSPVNIWHRVTSLRLPVSLQTTPLSWCRLLTPYVCPQDRGARLSRRASAKLNVYGTEWKNKRDKSEFGCVPPKSMQVFVLFSWENAFIDLNVSQDCTKKDKRIWINDWTSMFTSFLLHLPITGTTKQSVETTFSSSIVLQMLMVT